jgi:hypothetical protein
MLCLFCGALWWCGGWCGLVGMGGEGSEEEEGSSEGEGVGSGQVGGAAIGVCLLFRIDSLF